MSGRFPGQGFDDIRMSRDQFNEKKGSGDLAKNLNRVPILNHNGAVIGQSATMSRYLAKHFGLLGASAQEEAQIDAMCEHIVDIKAAFRKVVPYGNKMSKEEIDAANGIWFDTTATPEIEGRKERQLQWFLEKVEGFLPGDGYTVGGRPSLADAYFFNMLGEHAPELDPAKGEPFGSLGGTERTLQMYPKLLAVVHTFGSSPGMKHYLSTRGEMGF
jgi:glutathione S-transferase